MKQKLIREAMERGGLISIQTKKDGISVIGEIFALDRKGILFGGKKATVWIAYSAIDIFDGKAL